MTSKTTELVSRIHDILNSIEDGYDDGEMLDVDVMLQSIRPYAEHALMLATSIRSVASDAEKIVLLIKKHNAGESIEGTPMQTDILRKANWSRIMGRVEAYGMESE